METPTRRIRSQHTPTTKMSERRRSLFTNIKQVSIVEESELPLHIEGIAPLSPETVKNVVNDCLKNAVKLKIKKVPKEIVNLLKNGQSININKLNQSMLRKQTNNNNYSKENRCLILKNRNIFPEENSYDLNNCTSAEDKIYLQVEGNGKKNIPGTPKTFTPSTDDLRNLFSNALNFKTVQKTRNIFDENSVSSSDEENFNKNVLIDVKYNANGNKRRNPDNCLEEPQEKIPKLNEAFEKMKLEIIDSQNMQISTSSFYTYKNKEVRTSPPNTVLALQSLQRKVTHKTKTKSSKLMPMTINRGVSHKIRKNRRSLTDNTPIENILKSLRSEKFKFLLSKREFQEQVEQVHKILRSNQNPIKLARPLNVNPNKASTFANFSSSEEDSDTDSEILQIEKEILQKDEKQEKSNDMSKRKFFKSGQSLVKNRFKINNIKATITHGKLVVLKAKGKKRQLKKTPDDSFSVEQKAIKNIIEKLESSQDSPNSSENTNIQNEPPILDNNSAEGEHLFDDGEFAPFRRRIPYKTNDPQIIEQQHLLLDFLITNQICTEENFTIFIADPDNHKDEAAHIVDNLVIVVSENENASRVNEEQFTLPVEENDTYKCFRNRLPYNTSDPSVMEQQVTLLEFLITNNICTEEMFDVFIANPENNRAKMAEILIKYMPIENKENEIITSDLDITPHLPRLTLNNEKGVMEVDEAGLNKPLTDCTNDGNRGDCISKSEPMKLYPIFNPKYKPIIQKSTRKRQNRIYLRGFGMNQYQIDAGQKEFGAKQCKDCGLTYSAHEPEEELLHSDYHSSVHILKFNGWIDEDIIAEYPEWGPGGRIIRVSSSTPQKRHRVLDVLKVVDKELGFSYIIPTTFVAYFAIKKNQIVGVCLVQPLQKASKYICDNGLDCCSEEMFDVKCGISRIWVSPFHRRMRIASKLIRVVQIYTILGEEISMDQIAFSAPTEEGKLFAQKVTKRQDFLVYQ